MDITMDNDNTHKSRHHRRRNNHFNYLDKSSSEPDLTDPNNHHYSNNPTSSSFSLYNKSEPYIPFSALKTEYQRQFGGDVSAKISPRPPLRRRSTSLKLSGRLAASDGLTAADLRDLQMGESEQHAEYHPYTEDELSQCRRTLAHRPDHQFNDTAAHEHESQPHAIHLDGQLTVEPQQQPAAGAEAQLFATKHRTVLAAGGQHAAERCHLHLSGELSHAPEYRSQFVGHAGAPIEKSQSIPQLSNIRFQGKFEGVAEYRDSFREYDRYARRAPILNPGHLRTVTAAKGATAAGSNAAASKTTMGGGEYADKFQAPAPGTEKAALARHEDQFSLMPLAAQSSDAGGGGESRSAETADRIGRDVASMPKPECGKAKVDFLAMNGRMEYSPEYRSTYLDFPRSRPITNKPPSSIRLGDHTPRKSARSPRTRVLRNSRASPPPPVSLPPPQPPPNVHDPNLEVLPFMCQPEVRRARQDLLLKKRLGNKEIISTDQTVEYGSVGNAPIAEAPAIFPLPPLGGSASPRHAAVVTSPRREFTSSTTITTNNKQSTEPITFRLTVQNVDDPGNGTFRKTTPKFGRRSSVLVKEAHRLRNRSRIVEGNREYAAGVATADRQMLQGRPQQMQNAPQQEVSNSPQHSRKASSQSFVVLKEPCKQNRWIKTSWYS